MFLGGLNYLWLRERVEGERFRLTEDDHLTILKHLTNSNYIILTKRRGYLSNPMICFANFVLTFKWGYWTHALMNIEGDSPCPELVEAIGAGVKKSSFYEVFNCDSVCILKPRIPKGADLSWEQINEAAYSMMGKEYDTLGDLMDDNKLNCVEYVMKCLKIVPSGDILFHGLYAFVNMHKNLTPDMFLYCGSFEVVHCVRHDR